jgi:O-antigen ligase
VSRVQSPVARSAGLDPARILAALTAFAILSVFAMEGPHRPLGIAALAMGTGLLLLLLPGSAFLALIPLSGVALLTHQAIPGWNFFDLMIISLSLIAFVRLLANPNRAAWDIHKPGLLTIAFLLAPLLAVPFAVVSLSPFLGLYKNYVLLGLLFLALRRIVRPEQSLTLLWIFPLTGTVAACQLLWKTRGLGALLYSRMNFRNFYSGLAWGQSDYISAVLEICLYGTIVLIMLERRAPVRLLLAGLALVMAQGFLILFSRAGALSLLLFGGLLALGWKRERALMAGGIALVLALCGLATPGGQVLVQRFVDPSEYGSWYFRLITWETGIQRFLTHPWTGIGLNQGRYVSDVIGGESANSSILDVLGEQGIVGGIVFLLIIVAAIRLGRRAPLPGVEGKGPVRMALAGTVGAVVLHSLVEPTLSGHVLSVLFVYFLAFLTLQDGPSPAAVPAAG